MPLTHRIHALVAVLLLGGGLCLSGTAQASVLSDGPRLIGVVSNDIATQAHLDPGGEPDTESRVEGLWSSLDSTWIGRFSKGFLTGFAMAIPDLLGFLWKLAKGVFQAVVLAATDVVGLGDFLGAGFEQTFAGLGDFLTKIFTLDAYTIGYLVGSSAFFAGTGLALRWLSSSGKVGRAAGTQTASRPATGGRPCVTCPVEPGGLFRRATAYCFAAGTLVLTPAGALPIENLRGELSGVGHVVFSQAAPGASPTLRAIRRVFRKTSDHLRILEIRGADGRLETLRTTDAHPFQVAGAGWRDAADLAPGDPLPQIDGRIATVESTRREVHPQGIPVYNFSVRTDETYFVGRAGVWVHNDGGCQLTRVSARGLRRFKGAGGRVRNGHGSLLPARGTKDWTLMRNADGKIFRVHRDGTVVDTHAVLPAKGPARTPPLNRSPPAKLGTLGNKVVNSAGSSGRQASQSAQSLARRLGLDVRSGGEHLKVYDSGGNLVTTIPHSLHGRGTAQSIVDSMFRAAGYRP